MLQCISNRCSLINRWMLYALLIFRQLCWHFLVFSHVSRLSGGLDLSSLESGAIRSEVMSIITGEALILIRVNAMYGWSRKGDSCISPWLMDMVTLRLQLQSLQWRYSSVSILVILQFMWLRWFDQRKLWQVIWTGYSWGHSNSTDLTDWLCDNRERINLRWLSG